MMSGKRQPADPRAEREARLAQALRENLKRRKRQERERDATVEGQGAAAVDKTDEGGGERA